MGKPHYHFIGIGGIGMSALAHILLDRGYSVSGSDLTNGSMVQSLIKKNAHCTLGHHSSHVPKNSIVVYSSGISQDNPEVQEALRLQLPLMHRAELLAALMMDHEKIMVTGSHGKTTVTSLIQAIFREAGKDVSYAIGGLNSDGLNGYFGNSKYFIAEADESDGSLCYYSPSAVVITNLDDEHLVNFDGNKQDLIRSILTFASKVESSHCWYFGDSIDLQGISGYSFGFSSSCDLYIFSYMQKGWTSSFSISFQGKFYHDIELNLIGKYNIANAAAAMGLALSYGIEERHIRAAFSQFLGVRRRMEKKNDSDQFLFLEDYAHHPTEIANALAALREVIGLRRLIAVCQPHRFSRLQSCYSSFLSAFQSADLVVFTDVYGAGEQCDSLDYEAFIRNVEQVSHVQSVYVPYDELVSYLQKTIRVHDVCILLGAGSIGKISSHFVNFQPNKMSIGVVCGGRSCEHDISVLSAKNFSKYLSSDWYDVSYFLIDRQGKWCHSDTFEHIQTLPADSILSHAISEQLQKLDFVIPVLHGYYGEDGVIQGFLEMIGKPYSGPSVLSAAIGMDKLVTKELASSVGIPVVPYIHITKYQWQHRRLCLQKIVEAFDFPVFVKAVHLGSSIGVFEVHNIEELEARVHEVLLYDSEVLVEESRIGYKEIEVSCLGDAMSCCYIAPCCERRGKNGAIDYLEKYGFGGRSSAEIHFDVNLHESVKEKIQAFTERMFKVLKGIGSCRIDFFVNAEGEIFLSEVNTIPGMTEASPFLLSFTKVNWSFEQIAHQMIIDGLYRFDRKQFLDQQLKKMDIMNAMKEAAIVKEL